MTIDWHSILGGIAGVLALVAIAPYIKDILHGTTRPNIFSFGLWALLLGIAAAAQISAGASWSVLLIVGDFIGTSAIAALCLMGYGYGKYGWLEVSCTVLAILAIIAWQLEHQPVLAIAFAAAADILASIPTIAKAYRDPWSEAPTQWLMIAGAAVLAIISTRIYDPANLIFPAALLLENGTIGALAFFGRRFTVRAR
jgi:hypothetical protein